MVELDQYISKIYDGEKFDLNEVAEGKKFLIKLSDGLANTSQLISTKPFSKDDNGLIGEGLFSITIDIINKVEMPGADKYTRGGTKLCIVYYGICPELENFVTIVLWPEHSKSSNDTFLKIRDIILNDRNEEKVIKFSGNYRLLPPNEIHPYRSTIDVCSKKKWMYDWQNAPYIKEIGNTVKIFKNPINYRKVFLNTITGDKFTKYINAKVSVGIIVEKGTTYIKLKTPLLSSNFGQYIILNEYTPNPYYTATLNHDIDNINNIKIGDKVVFLTFETVYGKPNGTIMKIQNISSLELFSHVLSYILYNRYLAQKRLKILTENGYKALFKDCLKLINNYCDMSDANAQLYNDSLIFNSYLSPFFKIINGYVYYVPSTMMDKSDKEIVSIDSILSLPIDVKSNPVQLMSSLGLKNIRELYPYKKYYNISDLILSLKALVNSN